ALQPDVKVPLLGLPGSRELPCIRGRTVVPDSCDDTLVVGHPNHLGVFDDARATRTIVLTARWSALQPAPTGATVIPLEDPIPQHVAASALADVRRLAKHLRQLEGVQVAIRPRSPVLIVLLPSSSGIDDFAYPGVTTLKRNFPEYPGGVRIEPPFDAAGFDVNRYAAGLERVIMEEA
ncbi:MAG: hypothetical protein ACNYZH_06915, partial [Acidimicrobiia bacterium]